MIEVIAARVIFNFLANSTREIPLDVKRIKSTTACLLRFLTFSLGTDQKKVLTHASVDID
jgi:hypothetical protein